MITISWWTRQVPVRTLSEIPFSTALLDIKERPVYQVIAEKALHLQQLGMNDLTISKHLGVDNKTVTKALKWLTSTLPA
jgi:hypothetical protein